MKKFHLLLITASAILLSASAAAQPGINQTDSLGRKQGFWKKYVHDTLKYEGTFKDDIPSGEFRYYFPDGTLKAVTHYLPDGKTAVTVLYHTNGRRNAEGTYINRKKDGEWKYYNASEKLIGKEYYREGTAEGIWKLYYDDGGINESVTYKNGMREGEWYQYFPDSILKIKGIYQHDQLNGPVSFYDPDGKLFLSGSYLNDMKDGIWMYYNPAGSGERRITYRKGIELKEEIQVMIPGMLKIINILDIAYVFMNAGKGIIRLNSGEEVTTPLGMDDFDRMLNEYRFFRVAPDFIVSAWSVKNRKSFVKENPVLVLNPTVNREVKVQPEVVEAFMLWAGILQPD